MGTTFETAGVSILFTSLTDIMAFAVGASSVFPAVVGFCAYTATGVAFDFLFQVSPACFGRDVNACATGHRRAPRVLRRKLPAYALTMQCPVLTSRTRFYQPMCAWGVSNYAHAM
eukprot:943152-Rhodomonas_salina.1